MGRWIEWKLERDAAPDEVRRVEAGLAAIKPAIKSIADDILAEGPKPDGFLTRMAVGFERQLNADYAVSDDVFAMRDGEVLVKRMRDARPLGIPLVRGEQAGQTLGFSDYAVFGALGVVGTELGLPIFAGGDEADAAHVSSILRKIAAHSGYVFDLETILRDAPIEPPDDEDQEPRPSP